MGRAYKHAAANVDAPGERGDPKMFGIGQAVKEMQNGKKVSRSGWNGKGMWLALQVPDAKSKMSLPYVYMKTADDKLVPWLCSQTDLLANDWGIVA
jgi:hypothetical protein